jgi:hypothetical protein
MKLDVREFVSKLPKSFNIDFSETAANIFTYNCESSNILLPKRLVKVTLNNNTTYITEINNANNNTFSLLNYNSGIVNIEYLLSDIILVDTVQDEVPSQLISERDNTTALYNKNRVFDFIYIHIEKYSIIRTANFSQLANLYLAFEMNIVPTNDIDKYRGLFYQKRVNNIVKNVLDVLRKYAVRILKYDIVYNTKIVGNKNLNNNFIVAKLELEYFK